MNNVYNPAFVALLYRSGEYTRKETALRPRPCKDEYYTVITCPKKEMLGATAHEVADEFITMACAPEWYACARRPVEPGDLVTYAPAVYMFVDPDDTSTHPQGAHLEDTLLRWPHLRLVKLPVDWNHMRQLCTTSTYPTCCLSSRRGYRTPNG